MTDKITAILFDMDGLLLDTERVARDVFLDLVVPLGVDRNAAEEFFLSLVGSSSARTRLKLAEFLPGHDTDPLAETWRDGFKAALETNVPLRPGVASALDELSGRGVRMSVVTSTFGAAARHHLALAGLANHFERVTGGDEVSANKPDPAPYRETAQAMGLDPRNCAAFEDSDRGIHAAVAAGCQAVQVPDLRPPDRALPDLGQIVAKDLRSGLRALGLLGEAVA